MIQGDITQQKVDAIVNAANTGLRGGGGVDGAIHRAAGPQLDIACRKLNGCKTGQAKTTPGFNLPAKYIIHTPGPVWRNGNHGEASLLASCYRQCLIQAQDHYCQSIAFPSISTGIYGFPLNKAVQIAIKTVKDFEPKCHVIFVCFDAVTYRTYQKALGDD